MLLSAEKRLQKHLCSTQISDPDNHREDLLMQIALHWSRSEIVVVVSRLLYSTDVKRKLHTALNDFIHTRFMRSGR